MNISNIASIELDREKPFEHCIRFKDDSGTTIETLKVSEHNEWQQFELVLKAWYGHKDYNGL